jgi:probable phosphoglycerate mutase
VTTDRYPQRPFIPPPDAVEVLLVRHGASQAAVPGESFEMLEGHDDPPLSPEGEAQAVAVGERLARLRLDAVFVTTLQRTVQTAAPLLERTGAEAIVIPELREVRLGEWEGGEMRIRAAHGDPMFFRVLEEERWDVIPGAEPMEDFALRCAEGLRRIIELAGTGSRVAAFVHGGVIGELCHQTTSSRPFAFIGADNCSITRLVHFADGRRLLRGYNDVAHLEALHAELAPAAASTPTA